MAYRAFSDKRKLEGYHRVKLIFNWREMKFNRSRLKKIILKLLNNRRDLLENGVCVREKLNKNEIRHNQILKELPKYGKTTDLKPINSDWSIFFVTSPPFFMRVEL